MIRQSFTVVGAGPVGTLLAISLARNGYQVGLYEGRPDSRKTSIYQGKSINIALSDRGWTSLAKIGIAEAEARKNAIPMRHREIHDVDGSISILPYGGENDAIWSVSRGGINQQLLDIADQEPNITTYFEHRLVDVDFEKAEAVFSVQGDKDVTVAADFLFGADGAHSKVRRLAHALPRFSYSQTYMPQSYIELNIPANADGSHRMEKNALHIWPRKDFMLIALAESGRDVHLHAVPRIMRRQTRRSNRITGARGTSRQFFNEELLLTRWITSRRPGRCFSRARPRRRCSSCRCIPWSFNRKVGLIGDAAHAIVPFYGQGMNCGFEDCRRARCTG